jgi:hypothetical protein
LFPPCVEFNRHYPDNLYFVAINNFGSSTFQVKSQQLIPDFPGEPDTSKNSDFGSLRHDLTVPARLTVVFPGVFALA